MISPEGNTGDQSSAVVNPAPVAELDTSGSERQDIVDELNQCVATEATTPEQVDGAIRRALSRLVAEYPDDGSDETTSLLIDEMLTEIEDTAVTCGLDQDIVMEMLEEELDKSRKEQ